VLFIKSQITATAQNYPPSALMQAWMPLTMDCRQLAKVLESVTNGELCRRCGKESETIQHITTACEQLASTEYAKRHSGVAKIIHQKLAEAAELIEDTKVHTIGTPQLMYWRTTTSSCTGIVA
jgi:hypothetical protein